MGDRPRGDWDCVGVACRTYEEQKKQREESHKPQPWVLRKLVVGVVLAIVVWTYYVYVGRMCIKLLRRGDTVKSGIYITIFNVLFLMFGWTYTKVLVTPPGYARDHVPRCEPPASTQYGRPWDVDSEDRGTDDGHQTIATAYEEMSERGHGRPTGISAQSVPGIAAGEATELDAVPAVASLHAQLQNSQTEENPMIISYTPAEPQPRPQQTAGEDEPSRNNKKTGRKGKQLEHVDRAPPQTPVLAEEYRYCARDRLMKPMRTHHCRLCATCVLQYDHHCPWIGQCVGAYNRKFFLNFTFWSTWFTAWVFGTQLADLIVDTNGVFYEVDGQEIGVTVLAGLFTLFTASLTGGHTRLLILNATTVESLGFARVREKDKAKLGQVFSYWQCRQKHEQRKRWDYEWGRIEREGNLWWLEDARANWEQVMGRSVWEWFLPIGRGLHDGIRFPVNPRHDPDGRWRPRSQWPVELQ